LLNGSIERASLPIGIFGMVLWLLAVLNTTIGDVPLSATFGLMQLMPWFFWLGIVLIALSDGLTFKYGSKNQRILLLLITAIIFWGTPYFVEPLGRQHDTYWHAAMTKGVMQRGLESSNLVDHFYVENWSTFYVLGALILQVTGGSALGIIRSYPIFISSVLLLNFYVFTKSVLRSERYAFLACLFMVFGQTYLELHFSPTATGTAMAPLFLWCYLSKKQFFSSLSMFLFLAIVIMHPITPILLIATILVWFLTSKIFNRSKIGYGEETSTYRLSRIVFLCVVYVFWILYVATHGFNIFINVFENFLETIFSASRVEGIMNAFQTTFPYTPEVSILRRSLFFFYIFLGFMGSFFILRRKLNIGIRGLGLLGSISTFILSSFAISYIYQSVTFFSRPYDYMVFFASISGACLFVKPSGKRAILITSLLVLLICPCIIAPYVNDSELMVRRSEMAVMAFAPKYIPRQISLCAEIYSSFLFFDDEWNYTLVDYNSSVPTFYTLYNLERAEVIIFVASGFARHVDLMGFSKAMETNQKAETFVMATPGYYRIYDNGLNEVYVRKQLIKSIS
jgi:hypothetical protein